MKSVAFWWASASMQLDECRFDLGSDPFSPSFTTWPNSFMSSQRLPFHRLLENLYVALTLTCSTKPHAPLQRPSKSSGFPQSWTSHLQNCRRNNCPSFESFLAWKGDGFGDSLVIHPVTDPVGVPGPLSARINKVIIYIFTCTCTSKLVSHDKFNDDGDITNIHTRTVLMPALTTSESSGRNVRKVRIREIVRKKFTISCLVNVPIDPWYSGANCVGTPSTDCSHNRPVPKILNMRIHTVTKAFRWKADVINVEICFHSKSILDTTGINIAK